MGRVNLKVSGEAIGLVDAPDDDMTRGSSRADERRCGESTGNRQLVECCLDGDVGAWDELVERYERLVYAIPLREGLNADDAAEIAQATFEALVESLHRISDPDRLGSWLMTVSRRLTWRRRSARQNEVSIGVEPMEPREPRDGSHADEWENTAEMFDVIATLGDPCRSLILGLFFDPDEPSYHELADLLDLAVGSIGPLRGRCLSRLRDVLAGSEP